MSRTQFSLRTLFAAVAVVGIGAALWVAEPSWQVGAVEFLLLAWVPASAAILCFHSNGKAKAFWSGVTSQCVLLTFFYIAYSKAFEFSPLDYTYPTYLSAFGAAPLMLIDLSRNFRPALTAWAFAPIVGLLCVLTHWLVVRQED